MPKLNVPSWGQPSPNYCVPACIKMILEYLRQDYGDNIPRLSLSRIARIVETKWDGTSPKDVENINKYLETKVCIKFKAQFMGHFQDIEKELREKRPVIVWVNIAPAPNLLWHAVVVRGFDPDTNSVFFNDPWDNREKSEEVGVFIQKWSTEAKMVKLLISKAEQTSLEAYPKEQLEGGEADNE
jgi:ABC-type bacteriocin/lantibiotic exporter with double-glycine peptidase domain